MGAIQIRLATQDDANTVADYHDRCFKSTYASLISAGEIGVPEPEGTRRQLHEWFGPLSPFETWVAVVDDRPIGHVTVLGHQLVHLFVEPEHQGAGLGKRLLALGEARLAADGHTSFELHARVENLAAIAFYQAAGWTVTEEIVHTVEHGISYDERVMVKKQHGKANT